MNTAFVLGRYVGQDGYLGYKKDKTYPILISRHKRLFGLFLDNKVEVSRIDGTGNHTYKKERSFFEDWIVIPDGKYVVRIKRTKGGGNHEEA